MNLTESVISEIENEIYQSKNLMILLINRINGITPECIFNGPNAHENAFKYMIRTTTNFYITSNSDSDISSNSDISSASFKDDIMSNITEYYQLLFVTHLDPDKPIYATLNGNYYCHGYPEEYLTNNLEELKVHCGMTENLEWIEKCIIELNPELPELVKFSFEENLRMNRNLNN